MRLDWIGLDYSFTYQITNRRSNYNYICKCAQMHTDDGNIVQTHTAWLSHIRREMKCFWTEWFRRMCAVDNLTERTKSDFRSKFRRFNGFRC